MKQAEQRTVEESSRPGALHTGSAAACLSRGPCRLQSLILWADSAAGYIDVYDGVSDQGERRFRLHAAAAGNGGGDFYPAPKMRNGLYVKPSTNVSGFTVQYLSTESVPAENE